MCELFEFVEIVVQNQTKMATVQITSLAVSTHATHCCGNAFNLVKTVV